MQRTRTSGRRILAGTLTLITAGLGIYAISLAVGVLFGPAPGGTQAASAHHREGHAGGPRHEGGRPHQSGPPPKATTGRSPHSEPDPGPSHDEISPPDQEPQPAPEPEPDRTDTHAHEPSAEPVLEPVPEPNQEGLISLGEINGIPICSHDPTKWHGVVEYAADGSIACAYDHEHKDDPRPLDGLFGPLEYGEISYPWETHRENELKHRVYGWVAIGGQGRCMATNSRLGITATRFQAHMDGNSGAAVRFHSYFAQVRTCDLDDPGNVGLLQLGGHMDYGTLHLRTTSSEEGLHVPLANDPGTLTSARRIHGSTNIPEAKDRHDFTWYGANSHPEYRVPGATYVDVEVGIRAQDWGPIDPHDPTAIHFYGGSQNGSWHEPLHLLAFHIPSNLAGADGRVNYVGWADRHGRVLFDGGGCTEVGVDCVPLRIENAKPGYYQFRSLENGFTERYYDVVDPSTGQRLIRFPN